MARRIMGKAKAKATNIKTGNDKSGNIGTGAIEGPSPNPMTNLILTDLLLRGGGQLLRHAVEAALLSSKYDKSKAKKIIKGRSLTQTIVATAVARIATRSVPGAIVVGGASLAKLLYDRRRGKAARLEGQRDVAEQAAKSAAK